MTEENIIKELKSGNTRVLKHVYVHLDTITSFVTNNSGTVEDGHDIFQEALIVFYRNVVKKDFILTSSIKTYLYSIAKRMWLKKIRNDKMIVSTFEGDEVTAKIDAFEYEFPKEHSTDMSQQIGTALDELGGICKDILQLFYFKKMSLEEIKGILKYNSSQVVRQQKYRCLKRIKEKLNKTTLIQ